MSLSLRFVRCRSGRDPASRRSGDRFFAFEVNGIQPIARAGAFGECDLELRDYPGGHMIDLDPKAHAELAGDLRSWIDRRWR